jgi:ABC-2 type transport system permease protein
VKYLYVVIVAAVVLTIRLAIFRARRRRRQGAAPAGPATGSSLRGRLPRLPERSFGDVGLVAGREIKERLRGRIFRVGTLIILAAVAAAIIIPSVSHGSSETTQTVGVVGGLSPEAKQLVLAAGQSNQDVVKFVDEPSLAAASADLSSGQVDLAIVDTDEVLLDQPATAKNSPADPGLVAEVAEYLGVVQAYRTAGLTPAQAAQITNSKSVPVHTLRPGSKAPNNSTFVIGLIMLFVMLNQYNTWILIGVMQEKSSRVVEVLLATVRPIQLLGGKVLGIGMVALGQATLVVGFALLLGKAVGSNLLHGGAPLVVVCQLLWLILGYGFYCWVYAAAGSMAERQDQVQTLALPLSIPILIGYIFSITVASSGNPSLFYDVLAYLPPTAPFCMPVLVGLSDVSWWQFLLSVLITLVSTVGVAMLAARIYQRAVLRTGRRVRVRELVAGTTR